MADPPPQDKSYVATMLGSAASGMLARLPMHPIDTVKARLQVQRGAAGYANFLEALVAIARTEGLRGLYRGIGIAFGGSVPGSMLYFTSYERSRDTLPAHVPWLAAVPEVNHLIAGLVAEAVSCVFWVPIDVIKERMQVQGGIARAEAAGSTGSGAYYRNTADAVRQIWRYEGIGGIYKGYGATLASFGPFSALYFAFYEKLKSSSQQHLGIVSADALPFSWQVGTATAAGAAASFVTSPLDMAKLRLQVQRTLDAAATVEAASKAGAAVGGSSNATTSSFRYRNIVHGLRSIVAEEGWRALFHGAGARMAFHAPSTAISMTAFETCKGFFERRFQIR